VSPCCEGRKGSGVSPRREAGFLLAEREDLEGARPDWEGQCRGLRNSADDGKPRVLIDSLSMYLDQLLSVRVTDMRRSGALIPRMTRITATLQGDDGASVSDEVGVVRFRMRSGGVFLQFICGHCGRRAQVLRLYAGRILCGRCTAFATCAGASLRFAAPGVGLSGLRRHGITAVQFCAVRGARWRVALSSQPSLRRSEAVVRQQCWRYTRGL
jgi:hypothetical protein